MAEIGLGGKTTRSTSADKTVATTFRPEGRDLMRSGGGKTAPTDVWRSEEDISFVYEFAIQARVMESVGFGRRSKMLISKEGADASKYGLV